MQLLVTLQACYPAADAPTDGTISWVCLVRHLDHPLMGLFHCQSIKVFPPQGTGFCFVTRKVQEMMMMADALSR